MNQQMGTSFKHVKNMKSNKQNLWHRHHQNIGHLCAHSISPNQPKFGPAKTNLADKFPNARGYSTYPRLFCAMEGLGPLGLHEASKHRSIKMPPKKAPKLVAVLARVYLLFSSRKNSISLRPPRTQTVRRDPSWRWSHPWAWSCRISNSSWQEIQKLVGEHGAQKASQARANVLQVDRGLRC